MVRPLILTDDEILLTVRRSARNGYVNISSIARATGWPLSTLKYRVCMLRKRGLWEWKRTNQPISQDRRNVAGDVEVLAAAEKLAVAGVVNYKEVARECGVRPSDVYSRIKHLRSRGLWPYQSPIVIKTKETVQLNIWDEIADIAIDRDPTLQKEIQERIDAAKRDRLCRLDGQKLDPVKPDFRRWVKKFRKVVRMTTGWTVDDLRASAERGRVNAERKREENNYSREKTLRARIRKTQYQESKPHPLSLGGEVVQVSYT